MYIGRRHDFPVYHFSKGTTQILTDTCQFSDLVNKHLSILY